MPIKARASLFILLPTLAQRLTRSARVLLVALPVVAGSAQAQDWSKAFDIGPEAAAIVESIAQVDTYKRNAVTAFIVAHLDLDAYIGALAGTARFEASEALRVKARVFAIETIGMTQLPRRRADRSIGAVALSGEYEALSTYYCALALTSAWRSVSASLEDERHLLAQLLRPETASSAGRASVEIRLAEVRQVTQSLRQQAEGLKADCRATQFRVLAGGEQEARLALVIVEAPGMARLVSVLPADIERRKLRMTEAHGGDADAWGEAVLDARLYRPTP